MSSDKYSASGAFSASNGSLDVLEHILSHEDCDVDPINRIERATPLHLALRLTDPTLRKYVVESLLDAGADTLYAAQITANELFTKILYSIRDKSGATALDVAPKDDPEVVGMIKRARLEATLSKDDIADGMLDIWWRYRLLIPVRRRR